MSRAKRLGDESSWAAKQASRVELGEKQRRNYERERDHKSLAAQRIWRRVRDKVTGIHNAIVRHFAETYAFVALGNLSYGVVEGRDKGMPKNSKDDLHVWRLYDFKTKLFHRFSGLDLCDKCGYDVDRDVNGARNILARSLGLRGVSE
jgi:transposase